VVNKIQHFVRALLNSLRRLNGKLTELTGVPDGIQRALPADPAYRNAAVGHGF